MLGFGAKVGEALVEFGELHGARMLSLGRGSDHVEAQYADHLPGFGDDSHLPAAFG